MSYIKIIVVSSGTYPGGGAASNRHLSYLKGLAELGCSVKLVLISPDLNRKYIRVYQKGEYGGIKYIYTCNVSKFPRSNLGRIGFKIHSILNAFFKLLFESDKKSIFLLLSTRLTEIIPFLLICKIKGIKVFHERTEFPFISSRKSLFSKTYLFVYLKFVIPRFTGLYVITKSLYQYFSVYISSTRLEHILMTVEPSRFSCKISGNKSDISYCGSMYTDKDGVPILLEAFDVIAEKFKNIRLILIGDNSDKGRFSVISNKIDTLKHKTRVICTGFVEREKIPHYLCRSALLVLARPDNIQAKGGFPTKLGEYLATGIPVVVTKVGEIPDYLEDNYNAFLSEPDSAQSFAQKMGEALDNMEIAREIGKRGRELAYSVFHYRVQSEKLLHFFMKTI